MINDEKKSNGWKIAKIVVVILAVLGIIAAIVVPMFINKKETKEVTEEGKKVSEELFEAFREDKDYDLYSFAETNYEENLDLYKMAVTYKSIASSEFKEIECSKVDVDIEDERNCYNTIYGEENELEKNTITKYIPEDVFEKQYKKLFGSSSSFTHHSLMSGCYALHYDSVNKMYVEFDPGLCGMSLSLETQEIVDTKEDGNKLVITTKGADDSDLLKVDITYTFEKEESTGNYIFVSRESTDNLDDLTDEE